MSIADLRKTQDCVLMGRRDCARIAVPRHRPGSRGMIFAELPLLDFVAATSVGRVGSEILLDVDVVGAPLADGVCPLFLPIRVADKPRLREGVVPNLGIVSAYNDMLSAHQPYERFPAVIRDEAHALGVFGPEGRGLCAAAGVRSMTRPRTTSSPS